MRVLHEKAMEKGKTLLVVFVNASSEGKVRGREDDGESLILDFSFLAFLSAPPHQAGILLAISMNL